MKHLSRAFLARSTSVLASMIFAVACTSDVSFEPPDLQDTSGSISVHGAWTIEARDRDGRTIRRVEFENALTPCGQWALAGLIRRDVQRFDFWFIEISSDGRTDPIARSDEIQPLYPTSGRDAGKMVLQATIPWRRLSLPTARVATVVQFESSSPFQGDYTCNRSNSELEFTSKDINGFGEAEELFVNVAISFS